MFINVMLDRDTNTYLWEVHNGLYERVDHGYEQTEQLAQQAAAKEAYLYWLKYYRYRV